MDFFIVHLKSHRIVWTQSTTSASEQDAHFPQHILLPFILSRLLMWKVRKAVKLHKIKTESFLQSSSRLGNKIHEFLWSSFGECPPYNVVMKNKKQFCRLKFKRLKFKHVKILLDHLDTRARELKTTFLALQRRLCVRRIQIKVKFPCDNIIVSLAHNWVKFYTSTRKHEQREKGKNAIQNCTSMMPMLSTRYGENIKNTRHSSSSSLAQVAFNYRNVHFSISSNWKSRLTWVIFALVLSFIIVK